MFENKGIYLDILKTLLPSEDHQKLWLQHNETKNLVVQTDISDKVSDIINFFQ